MTDIVGSTEHAAELGDSAWRELVQQHHALVREALRRHGGRELDTAGDGFFAVFDAPAAAVGCALDIAEAVREVGIDIRAGVHVGEVEQVGGKVAGITVPIASRIMASAEPGEVLVSSTVRDLAAGSGLVFVDRGVRELKGVPGKWNVYAVARRDATDEPTWARATATAEENSNRRAAAVRRARSRPIWRRRPRLVAAAVVGVALAGVGTALLVWQPWQPPALVGIENSIGVIDIGRAEIIGQIDLGGQPGGLAVSKGAVWVTNTTANKVSKIDLSTSSVVDRIDVGRAPIGVAAAGGSIWVANSGERTVTRINEATGEVVATITMGNGPIAVTADGDGVWVANGRDSTIQRLDGSGEVGQPVGVAAGPIAIAADASGVWVASEQAAAVTRIEPATGVTLAAPIPLQPGRPTSLAVGAGAIWVAASDGTLRRIDPRAYRVTDLINVGGSPVAVLVTDDAVWLADEQGEIVRYDIADLSSPTARHSTGSAPSSMVAVNRDVWLAAGARPASHYGGTLREVFVERFAHGLDPALSNFHDAADLQSDGLVGYRRTGGVAGSTLLPSLAKAIPLPTNGGRRYTFELRAGLVYSDGKPVRPADFRRAIERSFQVADPESGYVEGPLLFGSIVGTDGCLDLASVDQPDSLPVARCDLQQGVEADDATNTVTINLSEPDVGLLQTLTLPNAFPIPEGVDMNAPIGGALPGTGPYTVSSVSDTEIRFTRNPHFTAWDTEVRPDGFADEIVWQLGTDAEQLAGMIERNEADVLSLRGPNEVSAESMDRLQLNRPGQLHFAAVSVRMAQLDPSRPPFNSLKARQALNLAVDRGYLAKLRGGPPAAVTTCQVLPPATTAYQPYCPYTLEPDPGGQWHGRDFDRAKQLVVESGTAGDQVVVGAVAPRHDFVRDYLVGVLTELGYKARADDLYGPDFDQVEVGTFGSDTQLLGSYTCLASDRLFCDDDYDGLVEEAQRLEATDPAAAIQQWTKVDHTLIDLGWVVPLMNEGAGFVSERVGNYQFGERYGTLLDQMWVQ
jgi:YVTN family beta-propeller protein